MTEPFIILSAPNGARRQKSDHPDLPILPDELARCAEEIVEGGASILHLHVRDNRNVHSLDVDRYKHAIAAIHDAVGNQIIIQVTTEAVGRYSRFEQMEMVKHLRPEAVSLALREICPTGQELKESAEFFSWIMQERIFPQYILYDLDDIHRFEAYRSQGVFSTDKPFVLLVIGRKTHDENGGIPELITMIEATNALSCPWAICGFGQHETEIVKAAAKHQGHARVGFENNICRADGQLLPDHSHMMRTCRSAANAAKRQIATVEDVRRIFSLS